MDNVDFQSNPTHQTNFFKDLYDNSREYVVACKESVIQLGKKIQKIYFEISGSINNYIRNLETERQNGNYLPLDGAVLFLIDSTRIGLLGGTVIMVISLFFNFTQHTLTTGTLPITLSSVGSFLISVAVICSLYDGIIVLGNLKNLFRADDRFTLDPSKVTLPSTDKFIKTLFESTILQPVYIMTYTGAKYIYYKKVDKILPV